MQDFLNYFIEYREGLASAIVALVLFYLLKAVGIIRLQRVAEKTKTSIDDFLVDILRSIKGISFLTVAIIIGIGVESIETLMLPVVSVISTVVIGWQIVRSIKVVFSYGVKSVDDENSEKSFAGLLTVVQLMIWASVAVFIMAQLGYNVTSVVAGLGIGGIAVALALQNILSDIFSSFSIYFDKPFKVGDFVVVGAVDGTVEKIGLKTTRLRSLRGEQVIVSNRQLTDANIQNFGRLERRRVVVHIGFEYETPTDKLKEFAFQLPGILNAVDRVSFDRVHFQRFGDSALIHELVYFVESNDYNEYVASENDVNMAIKDYCEEKGLGMAFPTHTVNINK